MAKNRRIAQIKRTLSAKTAACGAAKPADEDGRCGERAHEDDCDCGGGSARAAAGGCPSCAHEGCDCSEPVDKKKANRALARIFLSAALLAAGLLTASRVSMALYSAAYLAAGLGVLIYAARDASRRNFFSENILMGVATLGAFAIGEYPEAVMVMLLYQIGEMLEQRAVQKSHSSISALMDIRPDRAYVRRGGELFEVRPEDVRVGETLFVRPGERIPLDGTVTSGESALDTSSLTGESAPRDVSAGSEVFAGCVNLKGTLTIAVGREYAQSAVARILELVEHASEKKARADLFITKFARVYTPIVFALSAAIALLPPLLLPGAAWSNYLYRACVFLTVSCPCALVISVPLSFFAGIGGASRSGILVKGGNYLEALSRIQTVVFDKTGTLTRGRFDVAQVAPQPGVDEDDLLLTAAKAEYHSNHPIALALKSAAPATEEGIGQTEELTGLGVKTQLGERIVLAGNDRLMESAGIACPDVSGTAVHVARDGQYLGYIKFSDMPKPDAKEAIARLKAMNIRTAMLTGDSREAAEEIAKMLSIDEAHAELLPGDKVRLFERMADRAAFVGDGINDAPTLKRADVGVAMGGLGSDAAIEAADVVIMTDEPSKVAQAVAIARKTTRIAGQNIALALAVKFAVLLLSAFGLATMWEAVFADVGVSLLAVLNSMRALRT